MSTFLYLFLLVLLFVSVIILQTILSKTKSKWPGLLLPAILFLCSLIMLFNMTAPSDSNSIKTTFSTLLVLLVCNFPTMVLLSIYSNKRRK